MVADDDLHRHAVENLGQADALLFGRVTDEMMDVPAAATIRRMRARARFSEPEGGIRRAA
jgi:hypothetical protein